MKPALCVCFSHKIDILETEQKSREKNKKHVSTSLATSPFATRILGWGGKKRGGVTWISESPKMNFSAKKSNNTRLGETLNLASALHIAQFCLILQTLNVKWKREMKARCVWIEEGKATNENEKKKFFYSQSDDESKLCNLSRAAVSIFIVSHHTRGFNHCWWIVEPATQTLMLSLVTSFGEINTQKSLCFDREKMWELFTMLQSSCMFCSFFSRWGKSIKV